MASPLSPAPSDRMIESWRAIAIILLVWGHFTDRVPPAYLGSDTYASLVCHLAKVGIFIAFVVAGYVFRDSLQRAGNLGALLAGRLARIWPLLVFASIIIFLFLQIYAPPMVPSGPKEFYTEQVSALDLVGSMLFLEELGFPWVDGAFWPLLATLKFWIIAGVFAWIAPRRHVSLFALAAIGLAAVEMFLRLTDMRLLGMVQKGLNGVFIAQYLPYFAAGLLLRAGDRRLTIWAPLCAVIVCHVALTLSHVLGFDWPSSILVVAILGALVVIDRLLLGQHVLAFIGRYSFSWFLFHQMIGLTLIKMINPAIGMDAAVVTAVVTTFLISILGSSAFEFRFRAPLQRLLNAIFALVGLDRLRIEPAFP